MSSIQNGPPGNLDSLLEEKIRLAGDLCRLEEEMQPLLLTMDLRGLAAVLESGTELLRRGERLAEQKNEPKEKPLRELIEPRPEGAKHGSQQDPREQLAAKLSAVRAGQEVNRCLVEEGAPAVRRMREILSTGKTTYNRRGEIHRTAGGVRSGLDQNC